MAFTRKSFRFRAKGIQLAQPYDQMDEGYFPVLRNVRVLKDGQIDCRDGMTRLNQILEQLDNNVHSIRRLNDAVEGTFTRVVGAGNNLFYGQNAFNRADTGYSGNPLSLVPFRPNASPDPYMYVGDSSRMRKLAVGGQNFQVGIAPSNAPPTVSLLAPNIKVIDDFSNAANWIPGGTMGAVSAATRINTTATTFLYDNSAAGTGWASVQPAAMNNNFQPGAIIKIGTEEMVIRSVFYPISATSIAAIAYDSGTTGACSVALATTTDGLSQDCLVEIGSEVVRVQSIIQGPDGLYSFRCATNSNHAGGASVTGLNSFRVYTTGAYSSGAGIGSVAIAGAATTGIGWVSVANNVDLSQINGRPVGQNDLIHLSLVIDNPSNLTEGKILLDIGDGTFTENFLYITFQPSQLAANVSGTLTAVQTNTVINVSKTIGPDNALVPGSTFTLPFFPEVVPTSQTVNGSTQWTEFVFRVSDFLRVGSDNSKSLLNYNAARVQFTVAGNAGTVLNVLLSSLWIGGTYAPDYTPSNTPMQFAYRYRASATGARSNLSPANRNGAMPVNDAIQVILTPSTDLQVDTIDLFAFGGGLSSFLQVASYANASQAVIYNLTVLAAQAGDAAVYDDYQPFPISDLPHSGLCNVAGTTITQLTGDVPFNLNWVAGTELFINGVGYTLYCAPISPTVIYVNESGGAQNGVAYTIPEATIAGQPLQCLWSFGGQSIGQYLMGVGDPDNPGFLRWCKGNNADSASDTGNLEITSPSEPLMNGGVYDSRSFVISSDRLFSVLPTTDASGNPTFVSNEVVPNSGTVNRWAFVCTPYGIVWLGKEGIYIWNGKLASLSDATLYPLFPHAGAEVPAGAYGFLPVNYSNPSALRLSYTEGRLYFTYLDTNNTQACLMYDFRVEGWFWWQFATGATAFYQEEGQGLDSTLILSPIGNIYQASPINTDDGATISCQVRIPSLDQGDIRMQKVYLDGVFVANPQGNQMSVAAWYEYYNTQSGGFSVSGNTQAITLFNLNRNLQMFHNLGFDITWTGAGTLYAFEYNYLLQPYLCTQLQAQWSGVGNDAYGHIKEGWVTVISTTDVTFNVTVDGNVNSFTVPNTNGVMVKTYLSLGPLKGKLFGFSMSSPSQFIPFVDDIIVHMKPWGSTSGFMPFKPWEGMLT